MKDVSLCFFVRVGVDVYERCQKDVSNRDG